MKQPPLALMRVICMITVAANLLSESAASGCVQSLIVAIPNLDGDRPAGPSWERRVEILHGAQIAINKSECQIDLIKVNNGMCGMANNFNLLQQSLDLAQSVNNSIGIVGFTCNVEFSLVIPSLSSSTAGISKVATLMADLANPIATLDHKILLIRALFRFMKKLNWHKIGVITETENKYFSHTAEILYREARCDPNIDIVTYQQMQVQTNSEATHHSVQIMSKITY